MKKIILLIAFVLMACTWVSAQKADSIAQKKTESARKLIDSLNHIYQVSIHLSNHIEAQKSGQVIDSRNRAHIDTDIKDISMLLGYFEKDVQKTHGLYTIEERSEISEQSENLYLRDSLMNIILLTLSRKTTPVYDVEMNSARNAITYFTTAIRYFKEYLQQFIPPIPNVMYDKINTIITLVSPKTDGRQYLAVSAYSHNVFGLSYIHRIGNVTAAKVVSYLGVEVIGPVGTSTIRTTKDTTVSVFIGQTGDTVTTTLPRPVTATYANKIGGYVIYGLRYDRILAQAGVGYFKTSTSQEDVSWKCGIVYTPGKFGIGFSYSPLTSAGIQLSYKW